MALCFFELYGSLLIASNPCLLTSALVYWSLSIPLSILFRLCLLSCFHSFLLMSAVLSRYCNLFICLDLLIYLYWSLSAALSFTDLCGPLLVSWALGPASGISMRPMPLLDTARPGYSWQICIKRWGEEKCRMMQVQCVPYAWCIRMHNLLCNWCPCPSRKPGGVPHRPEVLLSFMQGLHWYTDWPRSVLTIVVNSRN